MFLQGSKNYFYALSGDMFIKKSEVYFVLKTTVCHVLETAPRAVLQKKTFCYIKKLLLRNTSGTLTAFFYRFTLYIRSIYIALTLKLSSDILRWFLRGIMYLSRWMLHMI